MLSKVLLVAGKVRGCRMRLSNGVSSLVPYWGGFPLVVIAHWVLEG